MHYKEGTRILPQAKSYTNIYDIFGSTPFNNILYRNKKSEKGYLSSLQATSVDFASQDSEIVKMLNVTRYVTSEKYNCLNKTSVSKSVVHSTSTVFYDLDDIAKRHSFHCITELSRSTIRVIKANDLSNDTKHSTKGFEGKSNAIVQECATQIQPVLLPLDSREINTKKIKKKFPNDVMLSSEIFLRDDDYVDIYQKNQYVDNDTSGRQQKFWSYAKYRTEYTNPIPEDKKSKKKDHSKRIEDPCPCQLFSYSCPCTDKKSLTELAKRSKSKTVTDQITSTTKILLEQVDAKTIKIKKLKHDSTKGSTPVDKTVVQKIEKVIEDTAKTEPMITSVVAEDLSKDIPKDKNQKEYVAKIKTKPIKKIRRIICPNCKETVEITSIADEEVIHRNQSIIYRSKEILSTAYSYKTSSCTNVKTVDEEICCHEPRCEMIPICQILPNDNPKCIKSKIGSKGTPKVIRITKACRHHPPCTVVPSCQRANVLKNNCEFIPPCLHRPRCVNLPLCAPFTKNLHYDNPTNALHVHDMKSPEYTGCNYIHLCEQDSLENNLNQQYNVVHVNPRELLHQFHPPPYLVNPEPPCVPTCYSPCHLSQSPFSFCKSNKSCQYTCLSNLNSRNVRESSSDAIIFIRDVGCQFRNKNYSNRNSIVGSKVSSTSFEFLDTKLGNYYTNIHTLRYEDKFTHPITKLECSNTSTVSNTSFVSNCPSLGRHRRHSDRKSGFKPEANTSPYVAAISTYTDELSIHEGSNNDVNDMSINYRVMNSIQEMIQNSGYYNTFKVKSRKSLSNKHRNTSSIKRRRKSKTSSQLSRKSVCIKDP